MRLRTWLIATHTLPLMIIIFVIGLVLSYLLETQVLVSNLSSELEQLAALTAEMAAEQPEIWQDKSQATFFITRFSKRSYFEISLLDPSGKLLASNDPDTNAHIGQVLESTKLSTAQAGQHTILENYSISLETEIVEVLYPVTDPNQEVIGLIRLTPKLMEVQTRFWNARYLIITVTATALLIALGAALTLALWLERSLRNVSAAMQDISSGQDWNLLPEKQGPVEIRRLAQAFNILTQRLRSLEETRRQLLANLIHEVSRPIGAIKSATHAMLNGADEDPEFRRELLGGMASEIERLQPVLENLAKLHDRVLGVLELQRQTIDLSKWLSDIVTPWRQVAHEKGLHWQIEMSPQLPVLNIDPDRLAQVLGNLLSNAIKYTAEGGQVSVTSGVDDREIWIQVSDSGIGLNEEEQERIFEPFYRSNRDRRFPQGMGLGLTIAHDLVVAHGGRLLVNSQPGEGSQFTVWLPHENPRV